MRVAFVIPYFYPAWEYGGPPRSAFELARALVRLGHSVKVLTTDTGGTERLSTTDWTEDGAIETRYYRNLSNYLAFRHRLFLAPRMALDIRKELASADVLHIHELRSTTTVLAYRAAKNLSVPYVLSPHGGLKHLGKTGAKRVFDLMWGRRILRDAACLAVVSELEAEQAVRMGVGRDRLRYFPNSVRSEDYASLPARGSFRRIWELGESKVVLFLGRLNNIKGIDLLIRACAGIDSSCKLVVAGPDDGQESALRTLAGAQLADRVRFTGFLNKEEKLSAIVDADVCVLPSRNEIFGMVALETLMCERPIILSSACGLARELGSYPGVYEFENENVSDLKDKLELVLSQSNPLNEIAVTRRYVASRFSPEEIARDAESTYRRCLTPDKELETS